ncbi:MAG: hypothetical protein K6F55_01165 [Eubacterium sp.]|nr:hypothetical protein [Eubacterium sp.]
MPSINRIRVNNVKYNFGTQSYDDFSMRMYGRNTLYDLANGGGKSVLMLLLMQNLIPNSTLDDKQPIEKLFRDCGNTVIHSLIEWKLDECDIKDGLRYMTTGFAAKRAATTDEEREDGTAQIEYFNYVIFYRDYNRNDIVNLPLTKEKENISYKALRNYLHDLARNDKNIIVRLFDRKGEYQKFIAEYGLYESHWEIIRGINKTEGHVRTYFETNYKTTRRVIEDLLIEEIIEKAYLAKTDRETDKTESTVSLLMTIQEELKVLAEKKRGIQVYDHEQELIQLLIDRIESFMELYREQEGLAQECGKVYVTLESEKEKREERLNAANANVENAEQNLKNTKLQLDIISIVKELREYENLKRKSDEISGYIEKLEEEIKSEDENYRFRQAASEYTELKKAIEQLEKISIKRDDISKEAGDIYAVVANIRDRLDKNKEKSETQLKALSERANALEEDIQLKKKQLAEGETELAVIRSRQEYIKDDLKSRNSSLSELEKGLSQVMIGKPAELITEMQTKLGGHEKELQETDAKLISIRQESDEIRQKLEDEKINLSILHQQIEELEEKSVEFGKNKNKFKAISKIYTGNEAASPEVLAEELSERVTAGIVKIYEMKQKMEVLNKKEASLREGRLIQPTSSVEKVKEYLSTRHGADAMFGMDYISALPDDMKSRILERLPGIPYGVVVRNLDKICDDPGIKELDIDEEIVLYDRDGLENASLIAGEGVEIIRREKEFFISPKSVVTKLDILGEEQTTFGEEIRSNEDTLETLREDLDFVRMYIAGGYDKLTQRLEEARIRERDMERLLGDLEAKLKDNEKQERTLAEKEETIRKNLEISLNDISVLNEMASYYNLISDLEKQDKSLEADKNRIRKNIENISDELGKQEIKLLELKTACDNLREELATQENRWENRFAAYYVEDTAFPMINKSLPELETAFDNALGNDLNNPLSLEKEKMLRDNLNNTIEKQESIIRNLGVDIERLRSADDENALPVVSRELLEKSRAGLEELSSKKKNSEKAFNDYSTKQARLDGSISYAKERLVNEYGNEALIELEKGDLPEDIETLAKEKKAVLDRCNDDLINARKKLKEFNELSRGNDDLLRLASRIVETNKIDVSRIDVRDNMEGIREDFDAFLLKYDKVTKTIDRAKSDMLKVKLKVYESLNELNVSELAASIRDDVVIPENFKDAEGLLKRLNEVIEIIVLEKERIEKSLEGMQQLKDSFVEQCVERCLDVRTELDKLTKLSEISVGDTRVQMIKLSIPYVKDEFIKDRMSEYIDKIVDEVDKKDTDSERLKLLNSSLSMKKMFSVIVTDMSKIRLMLYKRERIKEQSRYLKYEEAVGSTGQSQGIYIQFLISIINYIAGMYAVTDTTSRSKTLFIDNPFGAAKDIYIWEPIFKLLEENNCQLIVPARGATPEITGRFDINYILGQQMTGNRTTTVVVDFSSKTKGEELEYKDLDYEQQTFDFI